MGHRRTVVTANQRLARSLRSEHDRGAINTGAEAWTALDVLPWTAWLTRLYTEAITSEAAPAKLLLNAAQSQRLWEECIAASTTASRLLQPSLAAGLAAQAWELAHEHAVPLDHHSFTETADWQAFAEWAILYRRRCADESNCDAATLAEEVRAALPRMPRCLPDTVELRGFDRLTAQQQTLVETLRELGTSVEVIQDVPESARDACRTEFADTDAELHAAADWCRAHLQRNPQARLGVVVPDIGALRHKIERIFLEHLHPEELALRDHDGAWAFELSLGRPLTEHPLAQSALWVLELGQQELALSSVSALLRSPYLRGASEEVGPRAALDARLRRWGKIELPLDSLQHLARRARMEESCPLLAAVLAEVVRERRNAREQQRPGEWRAAFARMLQAAGWPRGRRLDSTELQARRAWDSVLDEFSSLDAVAGLVSFETALRWLTGLAHQRTFQPESHAAPIQVMGLLEAAGSRFDALWALGLTDANWPGPVHPNPFLPWTLQRAAAVPGCDPAAELRFARDVTRRLVGSAEEVVFSSPQRDGTLDLQPSPLVKECLEPREWPARQRKAQALLSRQPDAVESVEDFQGPPVQESAVDGGSAILADQAACPFRAFAKHRLYAHSPDEPTLGPTPQERGTLVHKALELVWEELESHRQLLAQTEEDLQLLVRRGVKSAVNALYRDQTIPWQKRVQNLEQERLERLLLSFLELEKQRKPFRVLQQEGERTIHWEGLTITLRLDRVDELEDGSHALIDYKTGRSISAAKWEGERPDEPQLPLYAILSDHDLSALAVARVRVGECGFGGAAKGDGLFPSKLKTDLDERLQQWQEVLPRLAREFRAGVAVVGPKNAPETCQYCGLKPLCRLGEGALLSEEAPGE